MAACDDNDLLIDGLEPYLHQEVCVRRWVLFTMVDAQASID